MANTHAFQDTRSVCIHEVLKSLQGVMGCLQTQQAIWKFLENLSQQSKRMDWDMTSYLECFFFLPM